MCCRGMKVKCLRERCALCYILSAICIRCPSYYDCARAPTPVNLTFYDPFIPCSSKVNTFQTCVKSAIKIILYSACFSLKGLFITLLDSSLFLVLQIHRWATSSMFSFGSNSLAYSEIFFEPFERTFVIQ